MLQKKRQKKETKGTLKALWQMSLVSLLVTLMTSCGHAPVKREIEVWLIDEKELFLFRKIEGDKEQVLPIKDNKDMLKFMCIDQREYKSLFKAIIEKGN